MLSQTVEMNYVPVSKAFLKAKEAARDVTTTVHELEDRLSTVISDTTKQTKYVHDAIHHNEVAIQELESVVLGALDTTWKSSLTDIAKAVIKDAAGEISHLVQDLKDKMVQAKKAEQDLEAQTKKSLPKTAQQLQREEGLFVVKCIFAGLGMLMVLFYIFCWILGIGRFWRSNR